MLEVFSKERKKLNILENAIINNAEFNLNGLDFLDFSLPTNDTKNSSCEFYNLIKLNNIIYRIVKKNLSSDPDLITYHCEHISAKLIDDVLFGTTVIGGVGITTKDVINFILKDTDFILNQCDFSYQYEYAWEQENKLKALFDVPKNFIEKYKFKFDTSSYPYKVSLLKLNDETIPDHTIKYAKNMLKLVSDISTEKICTKLYCLGSGEGINQVNIKKVNNDCPYLLANKEAIEKYGIIEKVLIDRRYKDETSLLNYGKKLINELQVPYTEYEVDYTRISTDKPINVGDIIEVVGDNFKFKTFVIKVTSTTENNQTPTINIANKPEDIAGNLANIAEKQRINDAYSQGATQLYAQSIQGNADKENGLLLDFFIPSQASIINSVKLKTRMSRFRAYSKATVAAESVSSTSSSGGGSTKTSSSSGGVSTTSSSGGGSTKTSSSSGGVSKSTDSNSVQYGTTGHNNEDSRGTHTHKYQAISHSHNFSIPPHTHSIEIPSHTHNFSIPSHTHSVKIPAHTHQFTIPEHSHDITPGIYFFGRATYFDIFINGDKIQTINNSGAELDITKFLIGTDGKIPRGSWLTVEIRPNDLAYISISLAFQGYIQSTGTYTV